MYWKMTRLRRISVIFPVSLRLPFILTGQKLKEILFLRQTRFIRRNRNDLLFCPHNGCFCLLDLMQNPSSAPALKMQAGIQSGFQIFIEISVSSDHIEWE